MPNDVVGRHRKTDLELLHWKKKRVMDQSVLPLNRRLRPIPFQTIAANSGRPALHSSTAVQNLINRAKVKELDVLVQDLLHGNEVLDELR